MFICPTKRTIKANTQQSGRAIAGRGRCLQWMNGLRAVLVVNLALLMHANPGDVQVVACRHGAESHRRHILLFRATLLHRIGDGRGPGRYRSAARIVRPCVTELPACLGRTTCTKNGWTGTSWYFPQTTKSRETRWLGTRRLLPVRCRGLNPTTLLNSTEINRYDARRSFQ